MSGKKSQTPPLRYNSISEVFKNAGFPPPQHPLIALLNGVDKPVKGIPPPKAHVLNYYKISFRPDTGGMLKYGQTKFDFKEGGLFFAAPQQVLSPANPTDIQLEKKVISPQVILLIDPAFLINYPLAAKIRQYHFFSYDTNEALHLSAKEKDMILTLFRSIEDELESRIDEMSHDVIIAQIELLLNYAQRFYKRHFLTRKPIHHSLTEKIDLLLEEYFHQQKALDNGVPTVHYLAEKLNMSAGYLSDLLRTLVGQNTQQVLHQKLIDMGKLKLSTTNLSISEISYELGFEHPQSFSRLFKTKTKMSPQEFRSKNN
ncbi:AraC family transcriptional regulator [Sphingobacterium siyangense]|uniref:AraC family transcriptional regulator n=1 Tax=Sphingobacterium siyangense TaxID=459529 RepID=A0A420FV43_9SPHI|nr:response regulator transcription factor [Sphingobacterium siyangense]RKF36837.1 AraC family transcriptional regulator [Sphingobacterium siyangense]